LTRPSEVRRLLAELGLRPSQALGQNFLVDAHILAAIVEAARVASDDVVLEIGPGLGVLTEALAARARRVLAVEKDRRLEPHLRARFAGVANVDLRFGDALDLNWNVLADSGVTRLVSNLPYATGSAMLAKLFRQVRGPARLAVTLQLEVARRLTAGPDSRDFGLLGVWAQADHDAAVVKVISPTCFYPAPDVRSAVVVLERRSPGFCPPEAKPLFFALTKRAFGQRRKQLKAIFSGRGPAAAGSPADAEVLRALNALGVDPTLRPEALGSETWAALAVALQRGQISWNA
jgi:16S rRNA (adenine1518-N6/adenine1519-N6)-dimethyltransferase